MARPGFAGKKIGIVVDWDSRKIMLVTKNIQQAFATKNVVETVTHNDVTIERVNLEHRYYLPEEVAEDV